MRKVPRADAADGQLELALAAPAPLTGARLLLAPGPRAAEERLVAEVLAAAQEREGRLRAGDLQALRAPLRVVVPSRSLRQHLAARLVRAAGRSLLGVSVQTHTALALEALARAERSAPRGAVLAPVLVRRHAAAAPALVGWLGELEDGYGVVEAAVRDLFDAGFEPPLAEPLADAIAELVASGELDAETAVRAGAVTRVALDTLASLSAAGLGHRTALLVEARDALEAPGAEAHALLPTAGLWVHGYADATGLVSDWLEALVRAFAGRVLLDVPPDPAEPAACEQRYAASFRERMGRATGGEEPLAPAPPAAIALLQAPGTDAEVRAVAARVRALLDRGVAPESIGIVARRLEPYRGALHAQLGRLSVPFSAIGAGAGPDAAGRRAAALARLLDEGTATPVDAWLAADAGREGADVDLRIALHVLGAGRLGRVATLELDARLGPDTSLPLPVRRGGSLEDEDGAAADEGEAAAAARSRARNRRRHVGRDRLDAARARAAAVLARLEGWPARAGFGEQVERLRALVVDELGWSGERPDCAPLLDALDAVARELPATLPLAREEFASLAADALDQAAEGPLGGAGAGVQVLTITAARGRSFEHLFLLGMNRDGFPSVPVDDPVLPDALRARLRVVLPEMPVKARVRDEERHLFASLCAAAPHVLLAWQHADDDGRARIESPFVVRLRVARPELPHAIAPALLAAVQGADPALAAAPRPAAEHLALAGLRRSGAALEGARALALGAVRNALRDDPAICDPGAAALDVAALARHQIAALRELDAAPPPAGAPAPALGPWFGRVGRAPAPPDDGEPELFVTRLEDLARCPWQAFLRRELGLEPVPDALATLPAPNPLLLGKVVHAVLERIVQEALPEPRATLAEALALGPVRVPWPDAERLDLWLAEAAARAAREEGIAIPGFAKALARRVRPLLAVARAADWSEPAGPSVLGAELRAVVEVTDGEGRRRRIGMRADRADLDDGALRITDYKAGKARTASGGELTSRTGADTLHRHLLHAVREGRLLQAAAYRLAAAALAPGRRVEGRYLYLREDAPVLAVGGDARGDDIADAFDATARALLDAAQQGLLAPRLDTEAGKPPCGWCEVRAACVQGESGPRARLEAWVAQAAGERAAGRLAPEASALLRIVRLREDAREAGAEDAASEAEGEA